MEEFLVKLKHKKDSGMRNDAEGAFLHLKEKKARRCSSGLP